jgi:iron(III) transport system substrate-binding protein
MTSSFAKIALPPFLLAFALACGTAAAQPVVNLYSSMAEKDLRRLVAEFERRQGVKVNLWRSGKNRVLQRVISEARAGRHE